MAALLTANGLEWRWFGPGFKDLKWRELPTGKGYWHTDDPDLAKRVASDFSGEIDAKANRAFRLSAALPELSRASHSGRALASGIFPEKVLSRIEKLRSRSGHRLFEYQKAGVATALSLHVLAGRGCLIGDSMGLGKTIQAIAVARLLKWRSCLIVCPSAVIRNWLSELHEWWGKKFTILHTGPGMKALRYAAFTQQPLCGIVSWTSAQKIQKALHGLDLFFDGVIVDEGHYGKNPDAKRTRAVWGHDTFTKGKWVHSQGLIERVKTNPQPLILTGTPLPNRPIEVQPLLKAAGVPVAANYEVFGNRFCLDFEGIRGDADFSGAHNLDILYTKMRQAGVIRREVTEVLHDLPKVRLQPLLVDPDKDAVRALKHEAGLLDPATRATLRDVLAVTKAVPFEELSAVRAEMARAKVPSVARHIIDLVESTDGGQAIVVFWAHKDPLEAVAAELDKADISNAFIHGGVPQNARQRILDSFTDPKGPLVFQGTVQTCGTGINGLQLRSSHCVFADYPWTPAEIQQAIGRLLRIGQKSSVLAQFMAFEGSLDAYILHLILDKIAVQLQALDGKK